MPHIAFGTAQLGELDASTTPEAVLEAAWAAGFRRFDTAPSYAGGQAEVRVGTFLSRHPDAEVVTTKVGLLPRPSRGPRAAALGLVKAVLPESARRRLRGSAEQARGREMASGRFELPAVTASVEESLRRLGGRVDRLLLHEVRPLDVTPELVELLGGWLARGDVGAVGVATQNHDTAEVLDRGGELFTVVNHAVGPLHQPVELPPHVTTRIGHGLLGGGAEHLHRLTAVLDTDADAANRWRAAIAGTEFTGDRALTDVLLSRGPHLGVTEVLVATRRPAAVARAAELAARTEPLPPAVVAALADLVGRAATRQ
jgi:hypothetical protein